MRIGEGTFTFLQQNSINSANNLFAEAGGLQLSADESKLMMVQFKLIVLIVRQEPLIQQV